MNRNFRLYNTHECVSFRKTDEEFGALSNMASGFPIIVNNIYIRTSEALYQAMRYPNDPSIQKEIIEQKSPMSAKMISKKYRNINTRNDWEKIRVPIMKWCLRVKLLQNKETFGTLLKETADKEIVEESKKDQFWGAKRLDDDTLEGVNALGRLLMELRELYTQYDIETVPPLNIADFKLYGEAIRPVKIIDDKEQFKEKDKNSLF